MISILKNRLVTAVNEYCAVFKEGIPYAVLSRKYGKKSAQMNTDLDTVLKELKEAGLINIYMKRNGSKIVTPSDETQLQILSDYQRVS
ncbi:MAG TPA: hypothetical protein PK473_03135 [Nitrosomonas sp.]|nr:hypothetical protein [Agitococcus sp.]HNA70005.1 hypothetical protein [Nitrosomonas sp.]